MTRDADSSMLSKMSHL